MLYITNTGDQNAEIPQQKLPEFLKKVEAYIEGLKEEGKLIGAQPLESQGKTISKVSDAWKEDPIDEAGEMQVGYYHIRAKDLDEAIAIAKGNPEFEYKKTARIEVRPIKAMEESTGYDYPKES